MPAGRSGGCLLQHGDAGRAKGKGGLVAPHAAKALELARLASERLERGHLFRIVGVHARLERLERAPERVAIGILGAFPETLGAARHAGGVEHARESGGRARVAR